MKTSEITASPNGLNAPLQAYLIEDALFERLQPLGDPQVFDWHAAALGRIQSFSQEEYLRGEVGRRANEMESAGVAMLIVVSSGRRAAEWAQASADPRLREVMVI